MKRTPPPGRIAAVRELHAIYEAEWADHDSAQGLAAEAADDLEDAIEAGASPEELDSRRRRYQTRRDLVATTRARTAIARRACWTALRLVWQPGTSPVSWQRPRAARAPRCRSRRTRASPGRDPTTEATTPHQATMTGATT
jgi:hypothetical protein